MDGDLADIKDLVENGRDVNRRDGSDRTPLDYCVRTVGSKISYARTRVVENDNNIIIIIIQYFTRTYIRAFVENEHVGRCQKGSVPA